MERSSQGRVGERTDYRTARREPRTPGRSHVAFAPVEQSGVLATLSRWRPRVRIQSGVLGFHASAGQWRAQVAVIHPLHAVQVRLLPDAYTARSSIRAGRRPLEAERRVRLPPWLLASMSIATQAWRAPSRLS